jgi:hypothetical protein
MTMMWTMSKRHAEGMAAVAAVVVEQEEAAVVVEDVEEEEHHSNARAAVVVVNTKLVAAEAEDAVAVEVAVEQVAIILAAVATITMPGLTIITTMEAELEATHHLLSMTRPIWATLEVLKCPFREEERIQQVDRHLFPTALK